MRNLTIFFISLLFNTVFFAQETTDKNIQQNPLPVILTLKADTTNVVRGQQVTFILSLLYQNGYGDKFFLQQFTDSGFDILDIQDLPADEVTYKTVSYKRIRKKIIAQILKNESFTAAPVNVTWMVANNNVIGSFKTFHVVSELFSSNTLFFKINPLPADINLIAQKVKVNGSIKPEVCKLGQAMTYQLEVTSEANLKNFMIDQLLIDKELFDCYFSTSSITYDSKTKLYTKKFEFIIQPKQTGNHDLPIQVISYFDTQTKKIRQASTEQLLINILPDQRITIEPPLPNQLVVQEKEEIFLCKNFSYSEQLYFDWKLYWSIIICMILTIMLFSIIRLFKEGTSGKKRKTLDDLAQAINSAQQEGDYKKLYTIIEIVIRNQDIFGILNKADQKALTIFFNSLCVTVFSERYVASHKHLFMQANRWIAHIAKKISIF